MNYKKLTEYTIQIPKNELLQLSDQQTDKIKNDIFRFLWMINAIANQKNNGQIQMARHDFHDKITKSYYNSDDNTYDDIEVIDHEGKQTKILNYWNLYLNAVMNKILHLKTSKDIKDLINNNPFVNKPDEKDHIKLLPQSLIFGMERVKETMLTLLDEDEKSGGKTTSTRTFTVMSCSIGKPGGRYSISTGGPAVAAKKAATKRFSEASDTTTKMRLVVRQTGKIKEFIYEATRTKLPTKKWKVEIKAV